MRAVAYLRVSTDRQADKDLSIPAQRQAIEGWAKQHGATIEKEFVDAGESARSADRPAFLDLIQYAKRTPGLDVVLVYALDRFSRSRLDHALYRKILRDAGRQGDPPQGPGGNSM
jgi:DNA invertase Pin-like site-specific DNA recombinase